MFISNKQSKRFFTSLFASLLILLFPLISSADSSLVKQTDSFYVNDSANVLDSDLEKHILDVNKNFSKTKEKPQVVVVTIPSLDGRDINEYAYKLFEKYQIGNKDYDNGVLVLLAPNERKIRIEVGYGLEGAITDSKAGNILDEAAAYLSSNNFTSAIKIIFDNICNEVSTEYLYDSSVFEVTEGINIVDHAEIQHKNTKKAIMLVIGFFLLFLLLIWDAFFNKGNITVCLLYLLELFGGAGKSNGNSNSRSFGGGGRSGGGGASRGF